MSGINPREYSEYVGIIVDRDGPDNSVKVFIPDLHSKNVTKDKLGWSRFRLDSGDTNFPVPDLGQYVRIVVNTAGTSYAGEVIGLYQTVLDTSPSTGANKNLISFYPQWQEAINTTLPIRIIPDLVEQEVNGAIVRVAVEKGVDHSYSLLKNIISHAASFPMNGTVLPKLFVDTAIVGFDSGLSDNLLSSVLGQYIDFGKILSFIPTDLFDSLLPEVQEALTGITTLMGTITPATMTGTFIPERILPTNFVASLTDMLPALTSAEDVIGMFSSLYTTDFGLIQDSVIIENEAFGMTSKTISALTGDVTVASLDRTAQTLADFETQVTTVGGNTLGYKLSDVTGYKETMESFVTDSLDSAASDFLNG